MALPESLCLHEHDSLIVEGQKGQKHGRWKHQTVTVKILECLKLKELFKNLADENIKSVCDCALIILHNILFLYFNNIPT